jgi:predicted nucleotide-binding protein (sugar kinase/HSP70/actin superfamily)
VNDFGNIIDHELLVPRIGVVGEIFVKNNSQSNFHSIEWMQNQDVEVVIPPLLDFAMQYFVNRKINSKNYTERRSDIFTDARISMINKIIHHRISQFNNLFHLQTFILKQRMLLKL